MALVAGFLGEAKGRLLPASIPFRFFGAAVVFQAMAWLAVVIGARQIGSFAGGLGWPLAALHAVTLGMLTMTALGASLQLLPVATRQPLASRRAPAWLWALYTPGVAVMVLAMGLGQPRWLALGAATVVLALAGYALLLARNLLGARGMPVVVAHGWAALASLGVMLASASSLVASYLGHGFLARPAAVALHVSFSAYGFMGLLVLGFSFILVPMFALAEAPAERPSLASAALAVGALLLATLAACGFAPGRLRPAAVALGGAALLLHIALMQGVLKRGLRRRLGRPLLLLRVGWAGLVASLAVALALALGAGFERATTLFGVLLVGGLLSFLLGMLARIVPFLASMHAPTGRRGPPLPSALTAEGPLAVHFWCHLVALALLVAAVLVDSAWLARAAGTAGLVGAVAFARFFAVACRVMRPRAATAGAGKAAGLN